MADAVRATVANLINLYQVGRLTLKGANNLVARGMINAEEFRLITGEDYSGGGSAFILPEALDAAYEKGVQEA